MSNHGQSAPTIRAPVKTFQFQSNGRRFGFEYADAAKHGGLPQGDLRQHRVPDSPLARLRAGLVIDVRANVGAAALSSALNSVSD